MGTNDNNSSPFDLNDDNNSSQSLEDIIAEDNKAKSDEDAIINKDRRKDLTKKTSIIGGSVLAVCLIAGSLFFINPFGGDQNVGENDKKMTSIDDKRTTKIDTDGEEGVVTDDEFYREKGKYFPTKVEKWQEKPHNEQNEKDLNKSITKTESTTSLGIDANTLPSESSGYTSDDSKEYVDGGINSDYSYWTYEVFTSESGEQIERLLNPTFGDWSRVQYSSYPGNKYLEFNKLKDMFTNDWVNKNKDKKYSEYVPVFADWEGNDYKMGDKLLSSGPRWYGEVTDSTSEFKFNDNTQQYVVDVKADVKFTAWSKDQSKLEKTGTLTLKFVSNEDSKNDSGYKVLIDNASLKVDN